MLPLLIRRLPLLLALLLLPSLLAADDGLGKQIESLYGGRDARLLRVPQKGEKLLFDIDGHALNATPAGDWLNDAPVIITKVKVSKHSIHLKGKRLKLVVAEEGYDYDYAGDIELEIARRTEADEAAALKVLTEVFVQPSEPWELSVTGESRTSAQKLATLLRAAEKFATEEKQHGSARGNSTDHPDKSLIMPRPIYQPEPGYSVLARKEHLEGSSAFSLLIDAAGGVKSATMLNSLGLGLNFSALTTVHTWRFQPATKDGKPEEVSVTVVFYFRL